MVAVSLTPTNEVFYDRGKYTIIYNGRDVAPSAIEGGVVTAVRCAGERAGTRWANSTITVNLVQLDQQLSVNIRLGNKVGSSSTREFDDDSLKAMVDESAAKGKDLVRETVRRLKRDIMAATNRLDALRPPE